MLSDKLVWLAINGYRLKPYEDNLLAFISGFMQYGTTPPTFIVRVLLAARALLFATSYPSGGGRLGRGSMIAYVCGILHIALENTHLRVLGTNLT